LYIYRRRCTRYHELITEAKEQCSHGGQKSWLTAIPSELALEHSKNIEGDFIFLQSKTERTAQRIEKNINLLTALVAIGEGKQGLDENHGISRLSLLAAIFLPFSTVAAILSMQGEYAPGQSAFWLFWAVAIPLWAVVIGVSVLYDGVGRTFVLRVRDGIGRSFGKRKGG
jgi:Mg2+ and Co2+ transporter CorA